MKDVHEEISKLVSQIRKRPEIYIGNRDIFCLRAYITGFTAAMEILGFKDCRIVPLDFHDWVAKKYNLNSSVAGWSGIIHDFEKESAVDAFFELLDEYNSEKINT